MSKYVNHTEKLEFYFVTITCYNWIPLIEITNLYDKIYDWFNILLQKDCKISGYVIMPNHLHLLVFQLSSSPLLNMLVSNGKRFLSYEIVKRLHLMKFTKMKGFLYNSVNPKERMKGKKHNTFRPSFDARICCDEDMIIQKLDYIHDNPASKRWNLVDDNGEYSHSSAGFYLKNQIPSFKNIVHYQDILLGNIEI